MAKIRVHELAKEMGIPSKEMVMMIQGMGIDIKNHFSTLEDGQVSAISARVSKNKDIRPVESKKPAEKAGDQSPPKPVESASGPSAGTAPGPAAKDQPVAEKPPAPRPPAPSHKAPRPPMPSTESSRPRIDQGPVFESHRRPNENRPQQPDTNRPRPQGEGRTYPNGQARPQDGQRPYQGGQQRPPYQGGQQRPQDGQRPQQGGQRPPYQGGQQRPQDGQRPPYQGGQRPPYQGGQQRPQDGQRPYQGGQRPPGQRPQDGQRPFTGTPGTAAGRPAGDNAPKKPFRSPKAGPPKQDRRDHRPTGKPVVTGRPLTGLEKMAPSEIAEIDTSASRTVPVKATPRVQAPRPQAPARPATGGPARDYSRRMRKPKHKKKKETDRQETPSLITIGNSIQVRELADELGKSPAEIVKKLMELGIMATINQEIDYETVEILASLYEVEVQKAVSEAEKMLEDVVDDEGTLKTRPPIVTVMGHVDHGKTSLLDRIRQAEVAIGEAGGITQHIGAYQVKVNEQRITFIDTPGHEAFTAMRARGANVTDIAILVVAADDGVMPQTVEAISHIRAAKVPVIVAINKIDKPGSNPERIMQQLTEYNLVAEEYGGDTVFAQVSAKAGIGIDHLLEMVLLVAEMHDIKANPDRPAEGFVLEGKLDKGRGPVATVLIQKGTLHTGDTVISGSDWCKVRAMTDHKGRRVEEAYPSMPVEITGWTGVPEAGEKVQYCDEKMAKQITEIRLSEKKIEEQKQVSRVSLDDFFKKMKDAEVKDLNLIIKGDVQGSVEALTQSLLRLSTDEVKVHVIHSAAGAITETDVMLASASNAIIIGFNVRPDVKSRKYAEDENIDVRLYRVIYEAIQDVRKAMEGMLEPEYREKYLGRVEVRATFKVPNIGIIAGAYVIDGKIQRQAPVRILRDGVIIYEGKISSLKRFKDDVKEVLQNYECGIGVQDFNDIKEGDIIEAYEMEAIARELS